MHTQLEMDRSRAKAAAYEAGFDRRTWAKWDAASRQTITWAGFVTAEAVRRAVDRHATRRVKR